MIQKLPEKQFILYTSQEGDVNVRILTDGQTIWMSQAMIGELFSKSKKTISEHLQNIFISEELEENSVVRKFRTTASDGKAYQTTFYNLDAIIAVGYRVNSKQATAFRIWATNILREYIIKGFVLDDERMKQGQSILGQDYFDELLERVRSIRASERRIYQKITDIFAECSTDYVRGSQDSRDFFAMVQNKFHYAITGKTAAEIIHESANHELPHMGLKTFKHAPNGRVLMSDVKVAKNYLSANAIKKLERTISAFFDYIENLIEQKKAFTMKEFANSVIKFLEFNEFRILDGKGAISKRQADAKAESEYEKFNKDQIIESDFDKEVKELLNE
jgi:hypothetical protein